jgi:hypothetical protein
MLDLALHLAKALLLALEAITAQTPEASTYLERRMMQFWALRPSMTDSSLTLREAR